MRISTAKGQWNGVLKAGSGTMSLGQYSFPFTFNSRMEGGDGSSPEDMLAAALAGCFSMALSADLEKARFTAEQIIATAKAKFDNGSGKWTVESIDLDVEAKVPGIDNAKFQEIANGTKTGCPVSRALAAVQINLSAKLI